MSDDAPHPREREPFWVVVRTAGRQSEDLQCVFESLRAQREGIAGLVLVDSSLATQISVEFLRSRHPWLSELDFEFIECHDNVGPAAATNRGLRLIGETSPMSWVIVMDDDQGLPDDHVESLARSIEALSKLDPEVAAVGRIGHWIDRRHARIRRPPAERIGGVIAVDYLPTNFAPAFHLPSVLAAGGMREPLFIGQTEVALGLDLKRDGFRLYALGTLWKPSDRSPNWRGVTFDVDRSSWRRYYSVRNWIVLSREYLGPVAAFLVSCRSLGGAFLSHPRTERLRVTALAVLDGWTGRLGRTVEPSGRETSINP